MSGPFFKVGEIWREENKHNLQICHVAASTPRVNQGVQPWVSQRPLAILAIIPNSCRRRDAWEISTELKVLCGYNVYRLRSQRKHSRVE